jgi:glycopeptide antibiotics resistance protein
MANINFQIEAAVVLGPLLAGFCLLLAVRARRSRPGWTGKRALTRLLGAFYFAAVLQLTIFPVVVTYGEFANETAWYNLANPIPLLVFDLSFVPNVIMMIPLGMLIPLVSAKTLSLKRVAGWSAIVSLSIELTQLLMYILFNNGRSVDINDVIANTLGGMAGYLILRLASRTPSLTDAVRGFALPASAMAPADADPGVDASAGFPPETGGVGVR